MPFDPRQHVIGRLTAHTHQLGADNSGHEIARQIQNFLRGCAFKPLAKNRRHCPGKGLHFGPERHPNVGLAIFIDMQINADGVRAFLVFADILQIELLALARLLFPRVVGIGDERLPPLLFRERFEKVDDIIQLGRVHRGPEFTSPLTSCHSGGQHFDLN